MVAQLRLGAHRVTPRSWRLFSSNKGIKPPLPSVHFLMLTVRLKELEFLVKSLKYQKSGLQKSFQSRISTQKPFSSQNSPAAAPEPKTEPQERFLRPNTGDKWLRLRSKLCFSMNNCAVKYHPDKHQTTTLVTPVRLFFFLFILPRLRPRGACQGNPSHKGPPFILSSQRA